MKVLQRQFSRKEKAERLLNNLKNFRNEGKVSEEQYTLLSQAYEDHIKEAEESIKQRKEELKQKADEISKNLNDYSQELKNLELKFKVGELRAEEYHKESQKARNKLLKLQDELTGIQSLITSRSSDDVGGFLDISLEKKGGKTFALEAIPRLGPPGSVAEYLNNAMEVIKSPSGFFEKISAERGMAKPILFGCIVLFLSTVLAYLAKFVSVPFHLTLLYYICLVIGLFLAPAILLVLSKAFEAEADYESSFKIVAFGTVPLLAAFIPYFGPIIALYSLYIVVIGVEKLHKLPRGKATEVGLITGGIACLYILYLLWQIIIPNIPIILPRLSDLFGVIF